MIEITSDRTCKQKCRKYLGIQNDFYTHSISITIVTLARQDEKIVIAKLEKKSYLTPGGTVSSRQNEVNARGEYGGDATQLSKNLSITANGFVGLFQFR